MQYLLLDAARDLAAEVRDDEATAAILGKLAALGPYRKEEHLQQLIDVQTKLLKRATLRSGAGKVDVLRDRTCYGLSAAIVDNALELCRWNLADEAYKDAERAVRRATPTTARAA